MWGLIYQRFYNIFFIVLLLDSVDSALLLIRHIHLELLKFVFARFDYVRGKDSFALAKGGFSHGRGLLWCLYRAIIVVARRNLDVIAQRLVAVIIELPSTFLNLVFLVVDIVDLLLTQRLLRLETWNHRNL